MSTIQPGKYRHFKSGEYRVIGIAKHAETLEDMVVYESLSDGDLGTMWVRPLSMFLETVEIEGKKVPRFEFID